ncbi:MAG: DUF488 family protein [Actinomycetota bacterium]
MHLATSRYRNHDAIVSSGLAPLGITLGRPRFFLGYGLAGHRRELAPSRHMWNMEPAPFIRAYVDKLERQGIDRIMDMIEGLSNERGAVLLCFEDLAQPDEWCHRTVLAQWIEAKAGVSVPEL